MGAESVIRIRSEERVEVPTSWRFRARGQQTLHGVVFESCWPFGFVRRRRKFEVHQQVLVYPAIGGRAPAFEVAGPQFRRVAPAGVGFTRGL